MIFPSPDSAAQQVESFALPLSTRSQEILLEAKDSNCLVLAADQELRVYSLKGALLATFRDHALPISSICVVGCSLTWHWVKCYTSSIRVQICAWWLGRISLPPVGQLPCCDGLPGPLLTSVDMEKRQRGRAHPRQQIPPTGRITHNVQVI